MLTKNSPVRATGAMIIGHITIAEYKASLDRTSMVNGYTNRFLTFWLGDRASFRSADQPR